MAYTSSLSFPNIFSTITGKTMIDTSIEAINKRLSLLVLSAYTELFGDPNFGCGIYEVTFDYAAEITFQRLKDMISDSASLYESCVTISPEMIDVEFNRETNHILVTINYIVRNSGISNSTTVDLGEAIEQ